MSDEQTRSRPVYLIIDNAVADANSPVGDGGGDEPDIRPVELSDDALGHTVAGKFGDDWKFLPDGTALHWDGRRWVVDEKNARFTVALKVCRAVAVGVENQRIARQVSSKNTISAALTIATRHPRHVALREDFDRNDYLLNTPAGIVDLRSGQMSTHRREELMSEMTAVAPDGDCPVFKAFLRDATGNIPALQSYLQRAAGYALTGATIEHAALFFEGPGGSGKSTFLNALTAAMGSYGGTAPMDTFTAAKGERHPADLAMLERKRLVIASETQEGQRLDEAKFKSITGGDKITARYMRGNFFTYVPRFKVFIGCNYRPALRSADEAMRRRVHVVPFRHRPEVIDKSLPEKLRDELPGILRWAIEGASMWWTGGLKPPAAVVAATDEYFAAEDVIGRWIAERCVRGPDETALTNDLYRDFKCWASAAGEYVRSRKGLVEKLERDGFQRWQHPIARTRGFRGLGLLVRAGELDLTPPPRGAESEGEGDWRADPADEFDR